MLTEVSHRTIKTCAAIRTGLPCLGDHLRLPASSCFHFYTTLPFIDLIFFFQCYEFDFFFF